MQLVREFNDGDAKEEEAAAVVSKKLVTNIVVIKDSPADWPHYTRLATIMVSSVFLNSDFSSRLD